jgi:monoamine oxidase
MSGEETFDAEGVVVAVPLPILRRLRFDPPLDDALNRAIEEVEMGTAAKLVLSTLSPPPLVARQNRSTTWWCWTGTGADGRAREAVTAFAGTQRAVDMVSRGWGTMVQTAVPEADIGDDVQFVDWGSEPWTGGCYSALGPGQESLLDAFEQPGAIVFAGEHTTGSGSIDGAIVSGEGAAARLIEFLDGGSTLTSRGNSRPSG